MASFFGELYMKKIILFMTIMLISAPTFAQYPVFATVAQVKGLENGSVELTGKIVEHTGDIDYIFEDSTGSIVVKIGEETWNGVHVNENDIVQIYGAIDSNFVGGTGVWVRRIVKVSK